MWAWQRLSDGTDGERSSLQREDVASQFWHVLPIHGPGWVYSWQVALSPNCLLPRQESLPDWLGPLQAVTEDHLQGEWVLHVLPLE